MEGYDQEMSVKNYKEQSLEKKTALFLNESKMYKQKRLFSNVSLNKLYIKKRTKKTKTKKKKKKKNTNNLLSLLKERFSGQTMRIYSMCIMIPIVIRGLNCIYWYYNM